MTLRRSKSRAQATPRKGSKILESCDDLKVRVKSGRRAGMRFITMMTLTLLAIMGAALVGCSTLSREIMYQTMDVGSSDVYAQSWGLKLEKDDYLRAMERWPW